MIAKEGAGALLTGFGPTAIGYLAQGGAKFAGYELWKKKFVEMAGDQETAVKYRTAIYLGAASIAEYVICRSYHASKSECHFELPRFFADILLTPLEATRIRLVSERGYATGLISGFTRLAREGGLRELYAGFLPILCKSVTVTSAARNMYLLSIQPLDKYHTPSASSLSTNSVTSLCTVICLKRQSVASPERRNSA